MEIKYVKMPISVEEKKEYHAQGFRVVDARFAPEGAEVEGAEVEGDKPKRKPRRNTVDDEE